MTPWCLDCMSAISTSAFRGCAWSFLDDVRIQTQCYITRSMTKQMVIVFPRTHLLLENPTKENPARTPQACRSDSRVQTFLSTHPRPRAVYGMVGFHTKPTSSGTLKRSEPLLGDDHVSIA